MNDEQVKPLPCIICGRELENITEDVCNQVQDGTYFMSYGQYGSTVFDPCDSMNTYLEINICDPCMKIKSREQVIYHVSKKDNSFSTDYAYWESHP